MLNEHYNALIKNEELARDSKLMNEYIVNWDKKFSAWTEETKNKIETLYPFQLSYLSQLNPREVLLRVVFDEH